MLFQVFILSIILGFLIGFLVGGFIEWDKAYPLNQELRRDLHSAYLENEQLREIIHASSKPIRQARG
jgi:hypothetical protein